MTYYCPLCSREFKTLPSLKRHFCKSHVDRTCPVCGKEYKVVSVHAIHEYHYTGCKEHAVLWYLTTRNNLTKKLTVEEKNEIIEFCERFLTEKNRWVRTNNEEKENRKYRKWTESELEFIRRNYGRISSRKIGDLLGRPKSGVIYKIREMRKSGLIE